MPAGSVMESIGEVVFWLEVIWTPGLVLAGYLFLPGPED
jgi:hypothetical protein